MTSPDLREKIADTLFAEVWRGHNPEPSTYRDETERRQFLRYADKILALPEMEALRLIPIQTMKD